MNPLRTQIQEVTMQELKTIKANIDYPQEEETITSPHYTFRVKAPLNAEKVEVCIDGAPWRLCRYSAGFWWYDWTDYGTGEHEVVARILPFDSRNYTLRTRRFSVDLKSHPVQNGVTQFSVLTPNEPWMLAKLTNLLSREEINISGMMTINVGDTSCIQFTASRREGLREKLEAAGLKVSENEVLQVSIPNKPEELNRFCKSLAEKMINVQSLHGSAEGQNVKLVLAVDKTEHCASLVNEMGYSRA
jgi:hypothetical protein